ncbi:hypothetical protein LSAT2_032315 [Lamellibrachia satsuma]|nr:hypothetical protein LSAT2_032315 [Lamellibrachia satsuma]
MTKLLVALIVLSVACAVKATCDYDTCRGKSSGKRYLSMCRPENNYYTCNGGEPVFDSCGWDECIDEFGQCGWCTDTCQRKPDGKYQSFRKKRPYYYSCEGGHLYYQQCQPFQIFNAWSKECDCFDGVCKAGEGWRESFCRGNRWRVFCYNGYPRMYEECPKTKPYSVVNERESDRRRDSVRECMANVVDIATHDDALALGLCATRCSVSMCHSLLCVYVPLAALCLCATRCSVSMCHSLLCVYVPVAAMCLCATRCSVSMCHSLLCVYVPLAALFHQNQMYQIHIHEMDQIHIHEMDQIAIHVFSCDPI